MRECEGLDKACTGGMTVSGHGQGLHMRHDCVRACTGFRPDSLLGVERKICGLDLVYTLFVGSFYTVDLSQSHFGYFVYAHASDWFVSVLSHMFSRSHAGL